MTAAFGAAFSLLSNRCQSGENPPNIIFILADDLGYGDLSCYGQKKFSTPNIDKLAEKGLRFTDAYSGSTVCAPSRSSLLTGLHTGHTLIRGNKPVYPEGQHPLPAESKTLAEYLKAAGYITGAFGKWGLGPSGSEGDPNHQGVDEFFGYNCQRYAHNYYPRHLWHNQNKVMIPGNEGAKQGVYAPQLIHEKVLTFIEDNRKNPFFLYVPSVIPHAELFAPEAYTKKYRGKFLPEKSYEGTDSGEHFKTGGYGSQPEAHAAFAAMIHLLDEQVGDIVAKVEELDLLENTLIVFSSDNGPHLEGGADPDYFNSNGPLRGYKRDLYEGGIRVPLIARWDGLHKKGESTDHVCAFWDILPTFCQIAGRSTPENIDGISFLPLLKGTVEEQKKHEYLYWEFHILISALLPPGSDRSG
ncbi:sulfatase-like hydrolase/transferase [candidate division KSB1 bacterium]|nr:sulfatase-like hydrolase/transferase [candidate division KSB1 bacterium]